MVCTPSRSGTDVRNRGIGRARMFVGDFLLAAAVILWAMTLLMSPHGQAYAEGVEHVRVTVASFVRNSAIGTILLTAVALWLLFPSRRPRRPVRDWSLLAVAAVLILTSGYELIWLETSVLG